MHDSLAGAKIVAVATVGAPEARLPRILHRSHSRFGVGRYRTREPLARSERAFPDGVSGQLEVVAPLPVHVSLVVRDVVLASRVVTAPGVVAFQVSEEQVRAVLGGVTARLIGADGRALSGMTARLSTSQGARDSARADADGRVTFEEVQPGWMELEVSFAPELARFRRLVDVRPGEVTDLGELRIPRGRRLEGRVVGEDGAPALATLVLVPQRAVLDVEEYDTRHSTTTDSAGAFAWERIEPGVYWLRTTSSEGPGGVLVDLTRGDLAGVEVPIGHGSTVRLEFELSRAWRYGWAVLDADGNVLRAGHVERSGFVLAELADGAHSLELRDGALVLVAEPFDVAGGARVVIEH